MHRNSTIVSTKQERIAALAKRPDPSGSFFNTGCVFFDAQRIHDEEEPYELMCARTSLWESPGAETPWGPPGPEQLELQPFHDELAQLRK